MPAHLGRVEGQVFHQAFNHGVQAPRPDVLGPLVDGRGDLGDLLDRVRGERERDVLGVQQGDVLGQQSILGLGQNADEVRVGERFQFDPDRETALEFGNKVGRLGGVERAGCDEQDVVRVDHAVFGVDRAALDQRQQVALYALTRYVGAVDGFAPGDLVDLVDEDDAGLLDPLHGVVDDGLHIDQLVGLLDRQQIQRLRDLDAAFLTLLGHHVGEHFLELVLHFLHALRGHDLDERRGRARDLQLDFAVVERAFAQHGAHFLARAGPVGVRFGRGVLRCGR